MGQLSRCSSASKLTSDSHARLLLTLTFRGIAPFCRSRASRKGLWKSISLSAPSSGAGAAEIRAYWNRFKSVKLEERWYLTLYVTAGMDKWLEVLLEHHSNGRS